MYTVTLTMLDGSQCTLPAETSGVRGLVLVQFPDKISVTHEPSGLRIANVLHIEHAREVAAVLGAFRIDWSLPADDLRARYSTHTALLAYLKAVHIPASR